jgi:hypothetical protein
MYNQLAEHKVESRNEGGTSWNVLVSVEGEEKSILPCDEDGLPGVF